MTDHGEFQRILATHCDATGEERAAVDAHLATCRACADAFAAYGEVDALIAAAPERALPPRLSLPFAALLHERQPEPRASQKSRGPGIGFARSLAPAAAILFIIVALSAVLWSLNSGGAPVTATPTLTSTLTPTTITARETGPAAIIFAMAQRPAHALDFVPTPAPAPAPQGNSATLFAGPPAHATITH